MTASPPGAGSDSPTMATSGCCRRTSSTAEHPSEVWPMTRTAPPDTRSSSSSRPRENSRSRSMMTTVTSVIDSSWRGGSGAVRVMKADSDLPHELQQDVGDGPVRGVQQLGAGEAADPALLEHRLQVGERVEPLTGVVHAHAARADAAEGHVVLHVVHERVVDRHAARRRLLEHPLLRLALVREHIEGQGPGMFVDVADGVVDRLVALHREQRPEDLFLQ